MLIQTELSAFLLKEQTASCSAETHLLTALFAVIETFSQEDLDNLPIDGTGAEAIVENFLLKGSCPEKYKRFLDYHTDKYDLHG